MQPTTTTLYHTALAAAVNTTNAWLERPILDTPEYYFYSKDSFKFKKVYLGLFTTTY